MNKFLNDTFTLLIVCGLIFSAITRAAGSTPSETDMMENTVDSVRSISVLFRANESAIDRNFMTNEQSVRDLEKIIGPDSSNKIVGIEIVSHSSPDGPPAFNRAITQKRAEAISRLLLDINPGLDRSTIISYTVENSWVHLKSRIEADDTMPDKQEVLRVIGRPDLSEMTIERDLRRISNGAVFRELDHKILRYMRVGVITVTTRSSVHEIPIGEIYEEPAQEISVSEIQAPEELIAEEAFIGAIPTPGTIEYLITCPVALKTNLLFLAVGGFNVGLEVPIGARFSASVGFAYAYTRINNRFAVQTLQGGFEAKYWFNRNKRPLTGWNLGIYGLYSSRFDIQWQDGWQGDGFVSMGVAGGYSLPIGRSLNLEFAAAAGAFHTPEIRKYSRPQDGRLVWEETRQNVWRFFPAKLQVNLVWLIQSKKRVVER